MSTPGRLKIYLGYATGVGKTFQMLDEAHALQRRGVDVVLGYFEPHGRLDTIAQTQGLEIIPRRQLPVRGTIYEEMDTDAIIERQPQVCIVDELAHMNLPGSPRQRRWEDVQLVLDAGIDVITNLSVQHIASLNDQIWQITGLRVRDTVPDWVVKQAAEVVVVDVTPRALLHRLERGAIVPSQRARETVFHESTLVALRELAFRQAAHEVQTRASGVDADTPASPAQTGQEKLLVLITSDPSTAVVLRRARRVADFLYAEVLAVCIHSEPELAAVPSGTRRALERHLAFARDLRIPTRVIRGRHLAATLIKFARRQHATQIFLSRTHTQQTGWRKQSLAQQVARRADDREVTIVAERRRDGKAAPVVYAEDSAGGFMSTRFAQVRPEMTVDEAIAHLRAQADQAEVIYYAYVLDANEALLGVLSFRDLFSASRDRIVGDVMKRRFVSVSEETDKEEVARLFTDRHLLAIPVVESDGRMLGIVTLDDFVGVVQEEASEDIQKIGGMEALDAPYLEISFSRMVKKRAGWLAILFLGEMLTATAMSYFEGEISKAVVLALFLPLIISSGGNSGSQATTLVIRAMAMRELSLRDWWRVVRREFGAGLTLGSILGVIGMARILIWQSIKGVYGPHYDLIAVTIGVSLVGVVMFGTVAGSMLPFLLRRCGLDPASASAPFVATLVDVSGLVIYFTVASLVLRGTLL